MDQESIERIRTATFGVSRRGYDKRDVDRFLERLADWLETGGGDEARSEVVRTELERIGEQTGQILDLRARRGRGASRRNRGAARGGEGGREALREWPSRRGRRVLRAHPHRGRRVRQRDPRRGGLLRGPDPQRGGRRGSDRPRGRRGLRRDAPAPRPTRRPPRGSRRARARRGRRSTTPIGAAARPRRSSPTWPSGARP